MIRCTNCGFELRESAKFCDNCGNRMEPQHAKAEPNFARMDAGDKPAASSGGQVLDWPESTDTPAEGGSEEDSGGMEPEWPGNAAESGGEAEESTDAGEAEPETEPESEGMEPEGLKAEEAEAEGEEEPEAKAEAEARAGFLVFPDTTEQPIPPSQWLIGRTDLAKYLADPDKANEISRGHFTIFQDGDHFFVEDGHTMVQEKPSANKTWLVRAGSRILVTGTGRNELQDGDDIDVAELVRLQFIMK